VDDTKAAPPNLDIFGSEPAHNWCFFFEKADLARQTQDWRSVLMLEKQAKEQNLSPKFGPEDLPFIEAHAQVGDWQKAYDLSLAAQKLTTGIEPLLCANWARFSNFPSANAKTASQARQAFSCPNP
jgi:hypothetical protein